MPQLAWPDFHVVLECDIGCWIWAEHAQANYQRSRTSSTVYMLLHFQTRSTQIPLRSKIETKFRTFTPS